MSRRWYVGPWSLLLLAACTLPAPVPDTQPALVKLPEPPASAVAVPVPPPAPAAAVAPAASTPAEGQQADSATRDMLAYHDRVRQLPPPELAAELARLNETPPSPRTTLQLALLLGQTRSNGDLGRALGLLDALLRSAAPEAAPWQPLARLVAARYADQRRLEEQIERQNQQARDNQRKLDQLNEKLEALKAIERSLTTRPPAGASVPPAGAAPSASVPAPKGPVP